MAIPRLSSLIRAVTVYHDGAMVTRVADLPERTPGELALSGLPLCLEDGSLRVRVEGAAATVCDAHVALDVAAVDAALAPPEDAEWRATCRAEAEAIAVVESLESCSGWLDGVQLKPRAEAQRGSLPATIPVQARAALLATLTSESERLADELAAARETLRLASERRAIVDARINAATSARQARPEEMRKSAVTTLRWHGPPASGGRVVIEYRVPGARWLPCYVVRFVPGQDRAEILFRAALRQRTGEDWSGVALTVSSADALAWCPLPSLPSRRIGRRQQTPATGWRAPPSGAESLYADYDQVKTAGDIALDYDPPAEEEAVDEKAKESLPDALLSMSMAPPMPVGGLAGLGGMAELDHGSAAAASAPPSGVARRAMSKRAVAGGPRVESPAASYTAAPAMAKPESPRADDPSAWLAYGALRLAGPDDGRRGRLQPSAPQEVYLDLLAEAHITVRFSVHGLLRQADAMAADTAGMPVGSSWSSPDPTFPNSWSAELPATVPADGAWHIVPVLAAQAVVEPAFICVPRESRDVFRIAVLANPFPTPMPGGPADCYLGDRFLLSSPLAATATGGSLRLGLGVEQGLKVARNVEYGERSAGVFGGTTKAEHHVRVTVANQLQRAVRIEVRERLPVPPPGNDDCTVEVLRVEPAWQGWHPPDRDLPGGHRWMIDLAAGAERVLSFTYTITFPAKQELAGGNRREA